MGIIVASMKALVAEFVAMVLFVWIGTGSAVSSNFFAEGDGVEPARLLTIAIAFGFGISVLAYAIGPISGGHINPAVTFAMMATGEINPILGLLYWVVQFGGAVCGSFLLWVSTIGLTDGCDAAGEDYFDGVCTGSAKDDGFGPAYMLGVNSVSPRITIYSAFILEAVGTYLLVFTVFCSAVSPKSGAANAAPIAIGWSVMLAHIILIPFTGCGINPARSFGPMIVDMIAGYNPWTRGWWVYYSAPFAGALCAAFTYKLFLEEKEPKKEVEVEESVAEEEVVEEVEE